MGWPQDAHKRLRLVFSDPRSAAAGSPMTYAARTKVSVEKTKTEIETTLARYGADRFAYFSRPPRRPSCSRCRTAGCGSTCRSRRARARVRSAIAARH